MRRIAWLLPAVMFVLSACQIVPPTAQGTPNPSPPATHASEPASPPIAATASVPGTGPGAEPESTRPPGSSGPSADRSAAPAATGSYPAAPMLRAAPGGGPGTFGPTATGPLTGKVVAVDPGHNGGNFAAAATINAMIWNGRENETCDTTGAQTNGGYLEALFNWNVSRYLTADLRAEGATVVLTRTSNTGVGPCVTERARIGNDAHANAAVSVHADGGPSWGRGFALLAPMADGPNNAIIGASFVLADDLRAAFAAGTGEPVSNYDGIDGIQPRDNLAGTNLSTVPKVFIECANMRNAADAALVTSPAWQAGAARAIAAGLTVFLRTG
jgi:N-acetylmuramoyl-L-alanine amidase